MNIEAKKLHIYVGRRTFHDPTAIIAVANVYKEEVARKRHRNNPPQRNSQIGEIREIELELALVSRRRAKKEISKDIYHELRTPLVEKLKSLRSTTLTIKIAS